MKLLSIIYILACFLFVSCSSDIQKVSDENLVDLIDQENPPVLTFTEQTYNFGKIIEGEIVNHTFTFKNTGKGILLISGVNATCGCTVPKNWPKGQMLPGEEGKIEVSFDSKDRAGIANKIITITANTSPKINKIALTGTVVGPDKQ